MDEVLTAITAVGTLIAAVAGVWSAWLTHRGNRELAVVETKVETVHEAVNGAQAARDRATEAHVRQTREALIFAAEESRAALIEEAEKARTALIIATEARAAQANAAHESKLKLDALTAAKEAEAIASAAKIAELEKQIWDLKMRLGGAEK